MEPLGGAGLGPAMRQGKRCVSIGSSHALAPSSSQSLRRARWRGPGPPVPAPSSGCITQIAAAGSRNSDVSTTRAMSPQQRCGSGAAMPTATATTAVVAPSGAALMRQLKAAQHWTQLQVFVQQHGAGLNPRHTSALVTHLAQLGSGRAAMSMSNEQQQEQQEQLSAQASSDDSVWGGGAQGFLSSLLPLLDAHLELYDARGLANVAWSLARLHSDGGWASLTTTTTAATAAAAAGARGGATAAPPVSQQWLARFCDISERQLGAFDAQQLANVLWAFARLGHTPPTPWMQAWCAALLAAVAPQGQAVELQALSSGLWSLASLPDPRCADATREHLDELLAAAAARLRAAAAPSSSCGSCSGTGQSLSNLLWAAAQLRQTPGEPLLTAARCWLQQQLQVSARQNAAAQQQMQLSDQALANVLWALGKSARQLQQQQQLRGAPLPADSAGAAAVAAIVAAVAERGKAAADTAAAVDSVLDEHRETSRAAAACSSLGTQEEEQQQPLMQLLRECGALALELSEQRLHSMSWRHASNVVWAAGALQLQPSPTWVQRLGARIVRSCSSSQGLEDQQVACVLWGLSQLPAATSAIGSDALVALLQQQQQQLHSFADQALSSCLLSAARMQLPLPDSLLQAWLGELARRGHLAALGGRAMTDSAAALALLRREQQQRLLRLQAAQPRQAQAAPGQQQQQQAWPSSMAVQPQGQPRRQALLAPALRRAGDAEWLASFFDASLTRLPSCRADELSGMGWAAATLGVPPPHGWLLAWQTALGEQASSHLRAGAAAQGLWALRRLTMLSGGGGGGPALGPTRDAAVLVLADALLAAAASDRADVRSLALAASTLAAEVRHPGSSSSSSRGARAAGELLERLLEVTQPHVLAHCSPQQLGMFLAAAAAAGVPLSPPLLEAAVGCAWELADTRQLSSGTAACIAAAMARLVRTAGDAPAATQSAARRCISKVLSALPFAEAAPAELAAALWAAGAGRVAVADLPWLDAWLAASAPQLLQASPSQLVCCAEALVTLGRRPPRAWRAAWAAAAARQLRGAPTPLLARLLTAAATLRCEVGRDWLATAGRAALLAAPACTLPDLAAVLWALGVLGVRAAAEPELLYELQTQLVTAAQGGASTSGRTGSDTAAALDELSPRSLLQLLQAAVLLCAPRSGTPGRELAWLGPAAAAAAAERRLRHRRQPPSLLQQQLQMAPRDHHSTAQQLFPAAFSRSALRRLRWRAWRAEQHARQAAATASDAAARQRQLLLALGPGTPEAAEASAALRVAVAALDSAVADAAAASAASLGAATGRAPTDAGGLRVGDPWLSAWYRASKPQLQSWTPSTINAALGALAALGARPPEQWLQAALASLRCAPGLSPHDAAAAGDALMLMRSPLVSSEAWLQQLAAAERSQSGRVRRGRRRRLRSLQWANAAVRAHTAHGATAAAAHAGDGRLLSLQQLQLRSLVQLQQRHAAQHLVAWWQQHTRRRGEDLPWPPAVAPPRQASRTSSLSGVMTAASAVSADVGNSPDQQRSRALERGASVEGVRLARPPPRPLSVAAVATRDATDVAGGYDTPSTSAAKGVAAAVAAALQQPAQPPPFIAAETAAGNSDLSLPTATPLAAVLQPVTVNNAVAVGSDTVVAQAVWGSLTASAGSAMSAPMLDLPAVE